MNSIFSNKRTFLTILLALSVMTGMAQTFTAGDLNYSVNADGVSVTVTGHALDYEHANGPLVIPESVNNAGVDYAVTNIGNAAFLYYFYLTSLTLPNSLVTIENSAFAYCSGFTGDLIIPNSVTTIEESAFFTCYSFDGDFVIGNSVRTIGDYAFNSCDGLHGVLNIPSSVESIGSIAFRYCNFSGMTVDPANPVFDSRDNCNAVIVTETNELINGCVNTVIPNTVTAIGDDAFCGLALTSIDIPNSVTKIGAGAFAFCFSVTGDLTIPNSVTYIGESAFLQCEGLDGTLTLGESVSYIGDWAFRKCSHISKAVSLATTPATLGTELGGQVFNEFGCQTLTVPFGCATAYQNSAWYDPSGWNGFYEFIETEPTAVSEVEDVISAVYPNPTQGMVKIEAEGLRAISVFSMTGAKVFETSASDNAFEYDFTHLGSGIYLIEIETTKGFETKRLTVL